MLDVHPTGLQDRVFRNRGRKSTAREGMLQAADRLQQF